MVYATYEIARPDYRQRRFTTHEDVFKFKDSLTSIHLAPDGSLRLTIALCVRVDSSVRSHMKNWRR